MDATKLTPINEKILSVKEVRNMTGLSRTAIWKNAKEGKFPSPYRITIKRIGWKLTEINKWIGELTPAIKTSGGSMS